MARDELLERFILAQQNPGTDLSGSIAKFESIADEAKEADRLELAKAANEWAAMRRNLIGLSSVGASPSRATGSFEVPDD